MYSEATKGTYFVNKEKHNDSSNYPTRFGGEGEGNVAQIEAATNLWDSVRTQGRVSLIKSA